MTTTTAAPPNGARVPAAPTVDTPAVQVALARVMADVRSVRKGDRNAAQGFAFRGIDAVLNAVGPALRTHGVIPVPRVLDKQSETVEVGQKRTPMRSVTLTVSYRFIGPAGDDIEAVVVGEAMDSGDKAYSKAMSVALRTALLQTLALPTDEPDPDEHVYERAPQPEATVERPSRVDGDRWVAQVVARLLAVATDDAVERGRDAVARSEHAQRDVSGLLSAEDRETLDIQERDAVTLTALTALVVDYVGRHHRAVRDTGPAEPA